MDTKEITIFENKSDLIKINFKNIDTRVNYMEKDRELDITLSLKTELYALSKELTINVGNLLTFYSDLQLINDILVGKAVLNNGLYDNDFIITIGSDKRTGYFEYHVEVNRYDYSSDNGGKDVIIFERSLDQTYLSKTVSELSNLIY